MSRILFLLIIFIASNLIAYSCEDIILDPRQLSDSEKEWLDEMEQNPWSSESIREKIRQNPNSHARLIDDVSRGAIYLPPHFAVESDIVTQGKPWEDLSNQELFVILRYGIGVNMVIIEEILESLPHSTDIPIELLRGLFLARQKTAENLEKAVDLYIKAADKGSVLAKYELGNMFYYGIGGEKDLKKSVEYMEDAAASNHINALYNVGFRLLYSQGVMQDRSKADSFIEKAAIAGHREAQFLWGVILYQRSDFKQAAVFWEYAAKFGHPEALFEFARMHFYGQGVPRNLNKAFYLCQFSAQKGYVFAQYSLGWLWETYGTSDNGGKNAIMWYEKAAAQNHSPAIKALKRLRSLTPP